MQKFKNPIGATVAGVGHVLHADGSRTDFALAGSLEQKPKNLIGKLIFGLAWVFPKMLGAVTHTDAVRTTIADAVVDLVDAGAGAGQLLMHTSGDVEVATLTFSDPAFGNAAIGVATASAITSDTSATGGTIAKFVVEDSNGLDVFFGSVTATSGGGDAELSSVVIGATDTVSISSFTYTAPL